MFSSPLEYSKHRPRRTGAVSGGDPTCKWCFAVLGGLGGLRRRHLEQPREHEDAVRRAVERVARGQHQALVTDVGGPPRRLREHALRLLYHVREPGVWHPQDDRFAWT